MFVLITNSYGSGDETKQDEKRNMMLHILFTNFECLLLHFPSRTLHNRLKQVKRQVLLCVVVAHAHTQNQLKVEILYFTESRFAERQAVSKFSLPLLAHTTPSS